MDITAFVVERAGKRVLPVADQFSFAQHHARRLAMHGNDRRHSHLVKLDRPGRVPLPQPQGRSVARVRHAEHVADPLPLG